MHWDCVDIGTSNFEYSIEGKVLLVEPIKHYLDSILDQPNITKANYAVGLTDKTANIYYIPEDVIVKNNLPYHLRGCNSIGKYHPVVLNDIKSFGFDASIVKIESINVISFIKLCNLYDIKSINRLKIDTEGYEYEILESILGSNTIINHINVELHQGMYNTDLLPDIINRFVGKGFRCREFSLRDRKLIFELRSKLN